MTAKITYKPTSFIPVISEPTSITCSDEVADTVREMLKDRINEKEFFVLITLDGSSKMIRSEVIHVGTVNQSLVHPREIFRPAILDNACGVIVVHNHPSGTLEASRADIQITNRLKEVGKLVGIELLDHVIISDLGHYSMSDDGLI